MSISPEEFVKHWMANYNGDRSQSACAHDLGISGQAYSSRAQKYRRKGVPLPQWAATTSRASPSGVDIAALTAIVEAAQE